MLVFKYFETLHFLWCKIILAIHELFRLKLNWYKIGSQRKSGIYEITNLITYNGQRENKRASIEKPAFTKVLADKAVSTKVMAGKKCVPRKIK